MSGTRAKAIALLTGLQLAAGALVAQDQGVRSLFPAQPSGYVTDAAGIVDQAAEARITSLAERLRAATGAEIAVVTLPTIGDREEADVARERELVEALAAGYQHQQTMIDALSAKIEMELGELDPDEAAVFMEELGISGSSLDRVIALSYQLLGLISFLTAGPDEVRAWPIPDGSTAVDAAAAIHTDLAKGFIRAETVSYEDLVELGSTAEARKAGRLRSEGKTYKVKDGDVLEILFSR